MTKGLTVHLSGICGIAMGTLALMLHEKGYAVQGSDSGTYPPMSDLLAGKNIRVFDRYDHENLKGAGLVIIGNALSRGNPEVEHVLNSSMPYMSMAGALREFFLKEKEVISVSGTHGKSTTTALIAHILRTAGEDPSMFVGAVAENSGTSHLLGSGRYFIIEGDEYDSAFFEKIPKFMYYRPSHLVLTSLEFDHADIFSSVEEIALWFKRLINTIPSKGIIVHSTGYPYLTEVMKSSLSRNISFGLAGADYTVESRRSAGSAHVSINASGGIIETSTSLLGDFNLLNIAAAAAITEMLGVSAEAVADGIATFQGIRRRQQLIYSDEKVLVYEDFAHHPTAIRYMLDAIREAEPDAALTAVYEPRSATSRRNVFQDDTALALSRADRAIVKKPFDQSRIPDDKRLDIEQLINRINETGTSASWHSDIDDIIDEIVRAAGAPGKNVVVIMSNGGFDSIYSKLKERLAAEARTSK
jgi:UDP-N-acetylmuramate: L-alanyl-gamma-D-glutamyl-meso-diaminopimelate ligase